MGVTADLVRFDTWEIFQMTSSGTVHHIAMEKSHCLSWVLQIIMKITCSYGLNFFNSQMLRFLLNLNLTKGEVMAKFEWTRNGRVKKSRVLAG